MSEPSLPANHLIRSPAVEPALPDKASVSGRLIQEQDGKFYLLTIHGMAIANVRHWRSAYSYNDMARDGRALPQILADVEADLKGTGNESGETRFTLECSPSPNKHSMGRAYRDCPWIMVASYNRQIEDLQRRVVTR